MMLLYVHSIFSACYRFFIVTFGYLNGIIVSHQLSGYQVLIFLP